MELLEEKKFICTYNELHTSALWLKGTARSITLLSELGHAMKKTEMKNMILKVFLYQNWIKQADKTNRAAKDLADTLQVSQNVAD